MFLLYRHTLRQIPRLVDVAPSPHGNVVREQLERHDFQDGKQKFVALWDADGVFDHLSDLSVPLDGNRYAPP